MHLNIRSLNRNFEELNIILNQTDDKYDLIILTEIRNFPGRSIYKMDNFTSIDNYGTFNQIDGIEFYVKYTINFIRKIVSLGNIKMVEIKSITNSKRLRLDTKIFQRYYALIYLTRLLR